MSAKFKKVCVYCGDSRTKSEAALTMSDDNTGSTTVDFKRREFFESLYEPNTALSLYCKDALVLTRHVCGSSREPEVQLLEKLIDLQKSGSPGLISESARKEMARFDRKSTSKFVEDYNFYKDHKKACLDPETYKSSELTKALTPGDRRFPLVVIAVVHATVTMEPSDASRFLAAYHKLLGFFFDRTEAPEGTVRCLQAAYYRVMLRNMTLCNKIKGKPHLLVEVANKMIENHPSLTNWSAWIEANVVAAKIETRDDAKVVAFASPTKRKRCEFESRKERLSLLVKTWTKVVDGIDDDEETQPSKKPRNEVDEKKPRMTLEQLVRSTKKLVRATKNEDQPANKLTKSLYLLSGEIASLTNNEPVAKILRQLTQNSALC